MTGRELIAWVALATFVIGWTLVLIAMGLRRRKLTRRPTKLGRPPVRRPGRDEAAEHNLHIVEPAPELFPGVPDNHLLTECPMVAAPGGPMPLRDWLRHFAGVDAWTIAVSRFYTRASADADVAGFFAGIEMDKLQRHFLAAIMVVTGQGVTVGVVRRMRDVHANVRDAAGNPITGATWDTVIGVLAGVLGELGTPPATLVALATTIAPIRAAIVVESHVVRR